MCNVTGSAELAAVGVSVSVFNLVSKLFNVPLLNVTTSFVAEEQAIAAKDDNDSIETSILLSLKLIMKNVYCFLQRLFLYFESVVYLLVLKARKCCLRFQLH